LLQAAVLGEVFDREALLALGPGQDSSNGNGHLPPDTLLSGLCAHGVLLSADELRPGAFRFRHPGLAEAVLGLTTESRRRELYSRAAAVLEALGGDDEHLARCYAGAGQIDLAGTRGLRGIDIALAREAQDVAQRGLRWLLPLSADRPLLRAELLERAAEVARRRRDWPAERGFLDEMAHQAQRTTQAFEPRLAARVALAEARARRRNGQFDASLIEARKAMDAANQAEDRRLLLGALSLEGDLCRRLGQPDPSQTSYARAQALAERLGDESGAVHARVRGVLARCFVEASDVTLSELEAAALAADDLGEEALFLEALAALVDLLRDVGRFNRALSEGQRGLLRARRLGLPVATARLLVALAYTHLEQGEVRMALANCEEAVELVGHVDGEHAEQHGRRVELCRVRLLLARGDAADLDGVERSCDYLVSRSRTLSDYELLAASLCCLAQAVHRRGGSSRARLLSNEALALVGKGVVPLEAAFQIRIVHGQILEACGDARAAQEMREQIRSIIVTRLGQLGTPAGRAVYVNMAAARAALPPDALRPPE
jgi:tetratricopeptide (TPR) repeat protein